MGGFLDTIDPEARELLLSVARPVSFVAGAKLVRSGEPARGAFIVREGEAEALVTLPGGETLTVARLGPGDMFGEMALVELGSCTATIRAATHVDGWFVAHEDFRALVSQCQAAAIRLQHAITTVLARRIGELNARLLEQPAHEDRPARAVAPGDPLAAVARLRRAPFEASIFLSRLPAFHRFSEDEIDEVASRGAWIELPRGHALFHANDDARAAFVVVRGAVEIVGVRESSERGIAVLGPGQLLGYMSVLAASRHSTHAYARETALLLEFPAEAFRDMYFGASRASARLRSAVQASLLGSLGRTNRALTRLISHARLESAPAEAAQLEAAYGSQLTTV